MSREQAVPAPGLSPVEGDELAFLRSRYRLWNEGGTDAMIREVWHPDITYHDPPDFPDATTKHGAAAVADHLNARLEAVPGATFELDRAWWVREGELVLNELSLRIGGQASGVQLDVAIFHLIRFDERLRAVELREHTRIEQALEAVRGP